MTDIKRLMSEFRQMRKGSPGRPKTRQHSRVSLIFFTYSVLSLGVPGQRSRGKVCNFQRFVLSFFVGCVDGRVRQQDPDNQGSPNSRSPPR